MGPGIICVVLDSFKGGTAETIKVESWCLVIRRKTLAALQLVDRPAFVTIGASLALGGTLLGTNDELMVVQLDSPSRLEAMTRQLIVCGLRMTERGRFADFAIIHGSHGLSMPCDWLWYEKTDDGGEVSFREAFKHHDDLWDFEPDEYGAGWVARVGHGFMLDAGKDHEVWLDFNTGRTIVSLKS